MLAVSTFTARQLAERSHVPRDRIEVIPLPVAARFAGELHAPAGAPGGPVDRPEDSAIRLLSVARLDPDCRYKGVFDVAESLPEAAARGAAVSWTVVGGGADLGLLEDRCRELGIRDRVTLSGEVSEEELLAAYREADVFVLPSVSEPCAARPVGEGFGIVYAEAACFGVPSIASTRGGGALDLVEHEVSGLTAPPGDPHALAAAILRLAEDRELRRRLGDEARRRVAERHLPEHFAHALRSALAPPPD